MNKDIYFLCEGDTVRYSPTGQYGSILKIHIKDDGDMYQLSLSGPDVKIWAKWEDIELIYPVG